MFVVTSMRSRRLPHVCEKLLIPLLPPPPPLLPHHHTPPQLLQLQHQHLLHPQVALGLQPFCLDAHRTTLVILPLASCSILQTFPSRMLQAFLRVGDRSRRGSETTPIGRGRPWP